LQVQISDRKLNIIRQLTQGSWARSQRSDSAVRAFLRPQPPLSKLFRAGSSLNLLGGNTAGEQWYPKNANTILNFGGDFRLYLGTDLLMMSDFVTRPRAQRTGLVVAALLLSSASSWAQGALNACDLNADGVVNVLDVQLAINMDLGVLICTADIEGYNVCNSDVVNRVLTAALGGACVVTSHSAALNWTASSSSSIAGYNIYRSTTSGGSFTKVNSSQVVPTSYTDTTITAGQTYYYVVTAVDTSGNESTYSNQVTAVIPTP
jgi:hypothetical protein